MRSIQHSDTFSLYRANNYKDSQLIQGITPDKSGDMYPYKCFLISPRKYMQWVLKNASVSIHGMCVRGVLKLISVLFS